MNSLNLFELGILDAIADKCGCAFLDAVMPIVTLIGEYGIFWIALAFVLLLIPKTRKIGLTMGVSLLLGLLIGNVVLKNVVARIRPYDMEGARFTVQTLLIPALSDFSFPSGHTLCCAEGAAVLMMMKRKPWGWIASAAAVLVMFSRMYLYVHYPTDILAGLILGILNAYLALLLVEFLRKKCSGRFRRKNTSAPEEH